MLQSLTFLLSVELKFQNAAKAKNIVFFRISIVLLKQIKKFICFRYKNLPRRRRRKKEKLTEETVSIFR